MPTDEQLETAYYQPQLVPHTIVHNLTRFLNTAKAEIATQLPADLKAEGVSYESMYASAIASINKVPPSDADLYEQIAIAIKPARKLYEEERTKSLKYAPRTRSALYQYLTALQDLVQRDTKDSDLASSPSVNSLIGKDGVLYKIPNPDMPTWVKPTVTTLAVVGIGGMLYVLVRMILKNRSLS